MNEIKIGYNGWLTRPMPDIPLGLYGKYKQNQYGGWIRQAVLDFDELDSGGEIELMKFVREIQTFSRNLEGCTVELEHDHEVDGSCNLDFSIRGWRPCTGEEVRLAENWVKALENYAELDKQERIARAKAVLEAEGLV